MLKWTRLLAVAIACVAAAAAAMSVGTSFGAVTEYRVQAGFWWNDSEPGRGYLIDQRDDRIFLLSYVYDETGNAKWYYGLLARKGSSGQEYTGNLTESVAPRGTNGQPGTAVSSAIGAVTVTFGGPGSGKIVWPTQATTLIKRFEIAPGSLSKLLDDGVPTPGIWWNSTQPGTGYGIDVQGQNIAFLMSSYRTNGQPFWCLAAGTYSADGQFSGELVEFAGGTPVGTENAVPTPGNNCGRITLRFVSGSAVDALIGNAPPARLTRFDVSDRPSFLGLIRVESQAADQVKLTWLPASSPNTPSSAIEYDVYLLASPTDTPSASKRISTVIGQTNLVLGGLSPETRYYLSVLARLPGSAIESLPVTPLEIVTLGAQQAIVPGAALRDVASYGLQSATLDGTTLLAPTSATIPPPGTVLTGMIQGVPFTGRVISGAVAGDRLLIQTAPVSLAEILSNGSLSLGIRNVDGNAAADALEAAYGPGARVSRLHVAPQSADAQGMERLVWLDEDLVFYVDSNRRTFDRSATGRALSVSAKLAALQKVNEVLKATEFSVTDFEVDTSLNQSLQWTADRKLKSGSFVSLRGTVRFNVSIDITLATFKAGICAKQEDVSIPLNGGVFLIPTPAGVFIPVPYLVDIALIFECEARLRSVVSGRGVFVQGFDVTMVWNGSSWGRVSPNLDPASTWGFTTTASNSGKVDLSTTFGLAVRFQAGYTKTIIPALRSDYGVGLMLPVSITRSLALTAEATPMPYGVPQSWGALDFRSLDLNISLALGFNPTLEFVSAAIVPATFSATLSSSPLLSLPKSTIAATQVSATQYKLADNSENGANNVADHASTQWAIAPGGSYTLASTKGPQVIAYTGSSSIVALDTLYARIVGQSSPVIASLVSIQFGAADDLCFYASTRVDRVPVTVSGYDDHWNWSTKAWVRSTCRPTDALFDVIAKGGKQYRRTSQDGKLLDVLSRIAHKNEDSWQLWSKGYPSFNVNGDASYGEKAPELDCDNPEIPAYPWEKPQISLSFIGFFDLTSFREFGVGKIVSLRNFGWQSAASEWLQPSAVTFESGNFIAAKGIGRDVMLTFSNLRVSVFWPAGATVGQGGARQRTYVINGPLQIAAYNEVPYGQCYN